MIGGRTDEGGVLDVEGTLQVHLQVPMRHFYRLP